MEVCVVEVGVGGGRSGGGRRGGGRSCGGRSWWR